MSKKNKNNDDYFDDCPICQATKKAENYSKELSLEELKETFREAKKKGATVGGEMFEEN